MCRDSRRIYFPRGTNLNSINPLPPEFPADRQQTRPSWKPLTWRHFSILLFNNRPPLGSIPRIHRRCEIHIAATDIKRPSHHSRLESVCAYWRPMCCQHLSLASSASTREAHPAILDLNTHSWVAFESRSGHYSLKPRNRLCRAETHRIAILGHIYRSPRPELGDRVQRQRSQQSQSI